MPILGTIASQFSGKPFTTGSFESIATVTGTTSQTITFSDIPQTFTHLQIRAIARTVVSGYLFSGYTMRVGNGSADSSSNYAYHRFYTSGNGTISSDGAASYSALGDFFFTASNALANNFAITIVDILDYRNTNKFKTTKHLTAFDNNDSGDAGFTNNARAAMSYGSGLWRSTLAIDTISLILGGSGTTNNANSHFALYGIKDS